MIRKAEGVLSGIAFKVPSVFEEAENLSGHNIKHIVFYFKVPIIKNYRQY